MTKIPDITPVASKKSTKRTPKVTMTQEQFDAALAAAAKAGAAEALASVPAKAPKVSKEDRAAASKAKKATAKADRRAAAASLKEAIAAEAGVTVAEVTDAFAKAHKHAAEDQSQYKVRFDAKLVELIGVPKYNRPAKAA